MHTSQWGCGLGGCESAWGCGPWVLWPGGSCESGWGCGLAGSCLGGGSCGPRGVGLGRCEPEWGCGLGDCESGDCGPGCCGPGRLWVWGSVAPGGLCRVLRVEAGTRRYVFSPGDGAKAAFYVLSLWYRGCSEGMFLDKKKLTIKLCLLVRIS